MSFTSQRGKESPWGKASSVHWYGFKLNLKGEGGNSKPAHVKVRDGITKLEGQGGPQLAAQTYADNSAANFKSCYDEPGTVEARGAGNREIQGKILQRS